STGPRQTERSDLLRGRCCPTVITTFELAPPTSRKRSAHSQGRSREPERRTLPLTCQCASSRLGRRRERRKKRRERVRDTFEGRRIRAITRRRRVPAEGSPDAEHGANEGYDSHESYCHRSVSAVPSGARSTRPGTAQGATEWPQSVEPDLN